MDLLIPSTFGADERDKKLRVVKFGMLARAVSIFGVERITIYRDRDPKIDQERNAELLKKHLNYAETPPYLRKDLIPFDEDLKNANILPALQIISHGYSDQFREGVIKSAEEGELEIKAGLKQPLKAYGDLEEGDRVTVNVLENNQAEIIDPKDIQGFWSFSVEREDKELGEVLKAVDKPVVGTSFHGDPVNQVSGDLKELDDLALVFGSAWRGIPDLVERGDLEESQLDLMVDFIPGQETKTVRTEEAVYICLSALNLLRS
ncbi:MAG: putative RNA uridine N3 methyltransferase [Candidatus Nanohaloarchaea archaeon]|nr:putative RNA uridine N3 methyltransferase [Candidatus Nanohaloarchaea archaeon]